MTRDVFFYYSLCDLQSSKRCRLEKKEAMFRVVLARFGLSELKIMKLIWRRGVSSLCTIYYKRRNCISFDNHTHVITVMFHQFLFVITKIFIVTMNFYLMYRLFKTCKQIVYELNDGG